MKKKLAVARAMLHRPAILFLDEPSAGMDPVAAAGLREELASVVRREGVTVFLTTHNLPEAERLCSRVAVIRKGRLLAEGRPADLLAQRKSQRVEVIGKGFGDELLAKLTAHPAVSSASTTPDGVHLELRDGSSMAPLVRLLVEQGAEIEEIRRQKISLEDVFLALVEEEDAS
jgi:ABC-2 type transport system ATP-binding protein